MRKVQFAQDFGPVAAGDAVAGGRPFAHAVDCQKCRLRKRGRKKGRGRVRFVVFRENNFAIAAEFTPDQLLHPDPFPDPERDGHEKTFQAERRIREITVQNAVELEERLFVERHKVEVADFEAAFSQAVLDCILRETGVVFLAREPFLLGGGDDFSVAHEAGCAVVIKSR